MPIFAVDYTYSDTTVEGRNEHRPAHRAWLGGLVDAGTILSTGPYADGSGALILFCGPDRDTVVELQTHDPFAEAGLVDAVRITEWSPVMGAFTTG
jgi:uncharacterized protein